MFSSFVFVVVPTAVIVGPRKRRRNQVTHLVLARTTGSCRRTARQNSRGRAPILGARVRCYGRTSASTPGPARIPARRGAIVLEPEADLTPQPKNGRAADHRAR